MNITHLTNAIPMVRKKKQEKLDTILTNAVDDWQISRSENIQIHALAQDLEYSLRDIEDMLKKKFKEKFKETITQYASDGNISIEELTCLKRHAQQIGISDNEMTILINNALATYSKEKKEKVLTVLAGIAVVIGGIVGIGALLATGANDSHYSSDDSHYNNVSSTFASTNKKCAYCGRRISAGSLVYTMGFAEYCCQTCVQKAKGL